MSPTVKSERADNPLSKEIAGLLCAAAVGLIMAVSALVEGWREALPQGYVAKVNGVLISEERLQQGLTLLANDKRNAVEIRDREFVLDRMIDEELLVQQGLTMGLPEHHRLVRSALVKVVRESLLQADAIIADAELEGYYQQYGDAFRQPPQWKLRAWSVTDKASDELQHLLAQSPESIFPVLSDFTPVVVPSGYLPADGVVRYLSPAILPKLERTDAGQFLLAQSSASLLLVYVEGKQEAYLPPLKNVRDQVERDYLQHQQELAFRNYLNTLRVQADVILK